MAMRVNAVSPLSPFRAWPFFSSVALLWEAMIRINAKVWLTKPVYCVIGVEDKSDGVKRQRGRGNRAGHINNL